VNVASGASVEVRPTRPVRYEPTGIDNLPVCVYRRNAMLDGEFSNLLPVRSEKNVI
jgi:hypothetical protein